MDGTVKQKMAAGLQAYLDDGAEGAYPHQANVLAQAARFLKTPVGDFIPNLPAEASAVKRGEFFEVNAATGTGKTRMFGLMAKAMNVPTLFVTPRNLLNSQTRLEFCEEIGLDASQVAVYDGKQPDKERKRLLEGSAENPPPQFVITTYQSLPTLVNRHELDFSNPEDVHYRPLIILDEVHTAQGEETVKIVRSLKDKVLVAGFTATDAGAAARLFEGQAPIYTLPIVEAIQDGLLCQGVRTGVIDTHPDGDWVQDLINTPSNSEYQQKDVEKFARDTSVVTGAVRFHLSHEDDQLGELSRLPTVFYTEGVKAAQEGARIFNEEAQTLGKAARAGFVSGNESRDEHGAVTDRTVILERFNRGELQALFNDAVLEMGFNNRNATIYHRTL